MDHDDSDLLGGPHLPIRRQNHAWWLPTSLFGACFCAGVVLITWMAFRDGRQAFIRWQERRHRLQRRRRHGIPDSDSRNFAVAYAEAQRSRQEHDEEESSLIEGETGKIEGLQIGEYTEPSEAQPSNLRQRNIVAGASSTSSQIFDRVAIQGENRPSEADDPCPAQHNAPALDPLNFSQRYNPYPARQMPRSPAKAPYSSLQNGMKPSKTGPRHLDLGHTSTNTEGRKHTLDDAEGPLDSSKKFRVEGEETLDGNTDQAPELSTRRSFEHKPQRGYKRQASSEDEATIDSTGKRGRDKRAKRTARGKTTRKVPDSLYSDEDRDQIMDLGDIVRGKKRDRAEAGSTFGGDDDSPDTTGKKARRRKRRVVSQDDVDTLRGKKRNHDLSSTPDSDDEALRAKSPKKRGKRMAPADDATSTDISMDEDSSSNAPSSRGRRIGEEWEANGERWKVGLDGHRMRQALIKKKRSRFSMPRDSQHPDSHVQMAIVVETWLTDDDFKAAEERGELYTLNESDREVSAKVHDIEDSSSKAGKALLWATPRKTSFLPRKAFKDSVLTNVTLNINPFDQQSPSHGRRVTSGHTALTASVIDSPRLRHSKSYSKWEKQDLEADAMAKLRKKIEEQKKATISAVSLASSVATSSTLINPITSITQPTDTNNGLLNQMPAVATGIQNVKSLPSASAPSFKSAQSTPSFSAVAPSSVAAISAAKDASIREAASKPASNLFGPIPQMNEMNAEMSASKVPVVAAPPWGSSSISSQPHTENSSSPFSFFGQTPLPAPASSSGAQSFSGDKGKESSKGTDATSATPASVPNVFARPNSAAASSAPSLAPVSSGSTSSALSTKGAFQNSGLQGAAPTSAFKFGTPSAPIDGFPASSGGGSLLTRLGGFASAASSEAPTGDTFSNTKNAGGATASQFSFGISKATAMHNNSINPSSSSEDANKVGNKEWSAPPAANVTMASSQPSPMTPKFSFGFAPKPVAPPFGPSPADMSSATTTPKFSFGMTGANQSATIGASSASTSNVLGAGSGASHSAMVPSKPMFKFGNPGNPASAPPAKPAGGNPSVFKGTSVFGTNAKPIDAPKPLFGFGSTSSTVSPTQEKQDKPAFSFNFGAPSVSGGAAQGSSGAFGFNSQPSQPTGTGTAQNKFGFTPPTTGSTFAFGGTQNPDANKM